MAHNTAHAAQHDEHAHRCTGAKWSRTPRTQHNTPSEHGGEQEPGGPGHRKHSTTRGVSTPVNRSQVVQHTAHATQRDEQAHP